MKEEYDLIIDSKFYNFDKEKFIEINKDKKNIKVDLNSDEIFNRYKKLLDFFVSKSECKVFFSKELSFFNDFPFYKFSNCIFLEEITFNNINTSNQIVFENCNFFQKVSFENCNFDKILSFSGDGSNRNIIKSLFINNCINKTLNLNFQDIINLYISNNKINEFIFEENFVSEFIFNLSVIYDKLLINNCDYIKKGEIILEYIKLGGKLLIEENRIENLIVKKISKEGKNDIELGINNYSKKIENLQLNYLSDLDKISISSNGKKEAYRNIYISNTDFIKTDNDLYILENLYWSNLIIQRCFNTSNKLIVQNCKLNYFKIKESNLGETNFNGVNIEKFYLENATLNDCIFNGVEFTKNYKLEEKNLSMKQLKDNYRQLKFIMDKNGNYSEANKFYDWEMSYSVFSWKGFKLIHENILGLFQLIISQFGNNWFLPLLWIILVGFIFSRLDGYYLISDFNSIFPFIDIKYDNYNQQSINSFFTNINPFDKSLFTDKGITWYNFLHKIILVILYWHLIVALKRTTKR